MNSQEPKRLPSDILTVIFRDDSPMIYCGDSPSYRTVRVKLTDEQREALAMKYSYSSGGKPSWEDISRAIIEPHEEARHE